jgi:parallel beta-helix repeat protein
MSSPRAVIAATYFVRQTVGKDSNAGTSPDKAWQHISMLTTAMHGGDTAYVGPGLYREQITVSYDGTPEKRITFIADTTGQLTGDPAGTVMIAGSEPMDGKIFGPHSTPGVYKAPLSDPPRGLVEMDGPQGRYVQARIEADYLQHKYTQLEVVEKMPSHFYYDEAEKTLYIHTSDGKPPTTHEMELIQRSHGILIIGHRYVTVKGFTFRHMGDAGIAFFEGSGNAIAVANTSYGSRQGIRAYNATDVVVYGNILFRNENCGVYFGEKSFGGTAIGNVAYENIKGIRWGNQSVYGLAMDNSVFENRDAGISIERADHIIVTGNKAVDNGQTQLRVNEGTVVAEGNCFQKTGQQSIADFFFKYKSLVEYQQAQHQDLDSREGGCGAVAKKVDVHRLHAETMGYAERARKILGDSPDARVDGAPGNAKRGEADTGERGQRVLEP